MSTKSFSKGLVEIISSSENSERVENEILQVFNAIADHKEALDVFRNFGIPAEKKIEAMSNLLGKRVDSLTLDLISLTISQGYGDNLVEISSFVSEYFAEKRGASLAKIISAIELDDKTQNSIKRVLKKKFGRKVELQLEVDESVIGGLSVSVGERTFDGLVSSRFQEVKSVLEGR